MKEAFAVRLTYYGHSSFLLEAADGSRVIIDPYRSGAFNGALRYGAITETADAVVATHEHDDHGAVDTIPGHPQIFVHPTSATVRHVDDHGHRRGPRRRGGPQPGQEHHDRAGRWRREGGPSGRSGPHARCPRRWRPSARTDVLLVPVGGFFTIDHKQAAEVVDSLDPRIVIPMHYKTPKVDFPISDVEPFLCHADRGWNARPLRPSRSPGPRCRPSGWSTYSPQTDRTVVIPAMEDSSNKARQAPKQPVKKPAKPAKRGRILPMKPGPLRRLVIIIIALAIFFGLGSLVSRIWTNYLWFAEVGQTGVFWTPFVAKLCVGLFFGVVFFGIFYGNLWLARKISPRLLAVKGSGDDGRARTQDPPAVARRTAPAGRRRGRHHRRRQPTAAAGRQSCCSSIAAPFGYADPLFNKDASFFVFTLPVWKLLVDFVGIAVC